MNNGLNEDIRIGFIGAGKVGFTLGKFFTDKGIRVTGYYSRQAESAREAAAFTDSKFYEELDNIVNDSDALFLTVPDGEISGVFQKIKDYNICHKYICHCSGALSSKDAFEGIEETGATGYSIHPLFPISSKYDCYKELSDAFFCLEGDKAGLEMFLSLFKKLGVRARTIDSEHKVQYHGACVFASNLICGVIKESLDILGTCGFDEEEALAALRPLIKSNISHVLEDGPVTALTGPIERGDLDTVKKHMASWDGETADMYRMLSRKVLECAKIKNPDRDYTTLRTYLS